MKAENFPLILCTSVIRSSVQGESHGGMYLVDLNQGSYKQVVDWDDPSIDWQGRGADRGLRGIAFYKNMIIATASDEIFMYDQDFSIKKSFRSPYLKHCHEIFLENHKLYLSSTGFDSILIFDLKTEKFEKGFCFRDLNYHENRNLLQKTYHRLFPNYTYYSFDPNQRNGPKPKDTVHINNVFISDGCIFFSGIRINKLMKIDAQENLSAFAPIPRGTHNVQLSGQYLLMNNTGKDSIIKLTPQGKLVAEYFIKTYPPSDLENTHLSHSSRQAFGRGLCTYQNYIIAGSSPATISIYDFKNPTPLKSVNLTKDIRNAIHGLEVYPYTMSSIADNKSLLAHN